MTNLAKAFTKPKPQVDQPVKLESIEKLFAGISGKISEMQNQ